MAELLQQEKERPEIEIPIESGMTPEKKKRLAIGGIVLAVILAALVVLHSLGYFLWPWESRTTMVAGSATQGSLSDRDIARMSPEELAEYLQRMADESQVTLQINTQPIFANGGAEGNFLIQNPPVNAYNLEVEVYLGADGSGGLVYQSGQIPPGFYIERDPLNTALSRGEHRALAYMNFYDDDGTLISTSSVDMTLVIQN